jgi:hypothetical protein
MVTISDPPEKEADVTKGELSYPAGIPAKPFNPSYRKGHFHPVEISGNTC